MLPQQQRLRNSTEFRIVLRRGVRVARRTLVLHASDSSHPVSRAGFVVPRSVGNAVVRNRVKRRLRHLVAHRFASAPHPLDLVVRALPAAARGDLEADFESAWQSVLDRTVAV